MSKIRFFALIGLTALLSACAKPAARVTYTPPALEDGWSAQLALSGGIAGLLRNIVVQSDGSYVVTDERANRVVEGALTDSELASLEEMIASAQFTAPEIQAVCADCFVYNLEIESGGQKMIVSADDVSLGDSGIGEVVQFLRGLMDAALK